MAAHSRLHQARLIVDWLRRLDWTLLHQQNFCLTTRSHRSIPRMAILKLDVSLAQDRRVDMPFTILLQSTQPSSAITLCECVHHDPWPTLVDGQHWDGTGLLTRVHQQQSPFGSHFNVKALIHEIEQALGATIEDVPLVTHGANHFGFRVRLHDQRIIVARVSRGDLNKTGFDAHAMVAQMMHDRFEIDAYDVLSVLGYPFDCRPLHHRDPIRSGSDFYQTNQGRRLFLFQKAGGFTYDYPRWRILNTRQKVWERSLGKPMEDCPITIQPSRAFCIALLTAKIEAALGHRGGDIDLDKGFHSLTPEMEAAREALLRLVPRVLPRSTTRLSEEKMYRFVLDHGDFGVHNMTIDKDETRQPYVTSVYDWEGGSVVPAILSEPKMVTTVDLVIDGRGKPSISRWGDGDTPNKMAQYRRWTKHYYKVLFAEAPDYKRIIHAGLDARRIWFGLRDGRAASNPDAYFEQLGGWARKRNRELDPEFDWMGMICARSVARDRKAEMAMAGVGKQQLGKSGTDLKSQIDDAS
ncbi:uncharacterized protein J7T54_001841 [Emericellopsis cladophorae]|uniref:Aminoglycoside phosphotransferase domain-containing protein n=1 Tax=Emericellopsis cladophorae TaxID=2686198 RepID=A0A9Q0BGQ9_9HYPO|nr:uncharacterized protein J7T54_001841 [Emericellopsis cladophorae]KAI6783965.1 hypothetical protein J7T54_001841 [Emericellopsis cladophorae]